MVNKEECTHFYENGKGAVEVIGWTYREFKSQKIKEVVVDKDYRGYCLLCGKLTKANVLLEDCDWYKKALSEFQQQY